MTSIGVAGPRLTWSRLNRLAWRALLPAWLSLCGASAGFAAEALRFDGTQDTVEVSSAQRFTAGDLERLTLDVAVDRIEGSAATLFMLSGGATVFMASFDAATRQVTLNSAAKPDPRAIGPKLAPAEPFSLVLSRAPTGWQVSINDSALEPVDAEELDPARPAQLDLAIGEVGLIGAVQSLTVALKGGETLVLQGDGVLKPGQGGVATAAGPRLGLYRRSDAVKEYGASGTSEIVRPSFRYFALVKREGALGLVFDWGGFLPLVPDATAPGRYVPADPRFAWAGAITFDPSNDGYFTASDVSESYRPAEPLLTNGARYHHIVSSAEKPYPKAAPGEVQLGSVFAQHAPSNFYFSIDACYDLLRMDRSDFTRTGCNAPLFAMPPKTSAGFRPGGEPGQIIPFGWSYEVFSHVYGTEFTSLVESASEVTDALSNMQGSDWKGSLAGLTIESSQSSIQSNQARQLLQNSHMGKIQQSIGTSHTIVLEPGEVLLHHCFIKRVMRMAPGAKPPPYYRNEAEFDSAEDLTAAVDRSIGRKDDCPEDVKQPLTVEAFLGLYGTHYAHSITYGGWGRNVTTYSRRSIETQLAESSEFKQALHIGFEKTGAKEDPLTGSGLKGGRTSGESSEGSTRLQSGSESTLTGWHCVGGSGGNCEHGIERSSLLVPVFLDLRLLDGLLGPPFFTDPAVAVDLRRRVQEAIAAKLNAATRTRQAGRPVLQAYSLDVEEIGCRGDARACNELMQVGDLVIYGKTGNGGNVDLAPVKSVPLSTFAKLSAPERAPAGAGPNASMQQATPLLPVLFLVDAGSADINQIGLSVAPSADPRIGQPSATACCGPLVLSPTLCRIKTGEKRDCVSVGNGLSCGDYYPAFEDMACPARQLSAADGESYLRWALLRSDPGQDSSSSAAVQARVAGANTAIQAAIAAVIAAATPAMHDRRGDTAEIVAPYGAGEFERRFREARLLTLKGAGSADIELSLSGVLRSVDLAQQLGVPRDPGGVSIAFDAPSPSRLAVFGPGDPHMYLRCPDGSQHTSTGCDRIDPANACPKPLVRYGGSCVKPDEDMEVAFLNDGAYVASARLVYELNGERKDVFGDRLLKGKWQIFKVPRLARGAVITGTLEGITRQKIFSSPISHEQGPRCFVVSGLWPTPSYDPQASCSEFSNRTYHVFNGLPLYPGSFN